ncbi:MAG TPA: GNAT family N-acetyltransferase [bacterium]|nr:GNAT family N-acetyltransferase [bacterium]HQP97047.1 GNAT family N-acetyltransferase [bacterium]
MGIRAMPSSHCEVIRPVSEAEWLTHLHEVGVYSFFQTPAWCNALCCYNPTFWNETVIFESGDSRFLLPLVSVQKGPGIASLESMPWGTYGGWIGSRIPTDEEECSFIGLLLAVTRPQVSIISRPGVPFPARPERIREMETHILDLSQGFEHVWEHRFAARNRTKIRNAARHELEVFIDNSVAGIEAYKGLYRLSMERWTGDLAFDPDFLDQWIDAPPEQVSLWLCKFQGEIVAGALLFYSPTEAHYWSGASNLEFSRFHANNFLVSRTIEDAVRRGCRTYNFGSSAGLEGVIQFKEQFGPERVPYRNSVFMHSLWRAVRSLKTWLGK